MSLLCFFMDSKNSKIPFSAINTIYRICLVIMEKRKIGNFKQFLNEQKKKQERDIESETGAPAIIGYQNYGDCTEYCLKRIEQEVGSLNPDEVFQMAAIRAEGRVKARIMLLYVIPMVQEYLDVNAEILVPGLDELPLEDREKKAELAVDAITSQLADEVLYAIYKFNIRKGDEKVESVVEHEEDE